MSAMASQDAIRAPTWSLREGEAGASSSSSSLTAAALTRLVRELRDERLVVPSRQFLHMVRAEVRAPDDAEPHNGVESSALDSLPSLHASSSSVGRQAASEAKPRLLTRLVEDVLEYCKLKLLDEGGSEDDAETPPSSKVGDKSKSQRIAMLLERCAETYSQWLLAHSEAEILRSASKSARALNDAHNQYSPRSARRDPSQEATRQPRAAGAIGGSDPSSGQRSARSARRGARGAGARKTYTGASFLEKVKLAPYGVLGNQLKNRVEISRGPGPDGSTVVTDWAAHSLIQTLGPGNLVPLYRWLGIGKEQAFRPEVREDIKAEGDVKLYAYTGGEREAVVLHIAEPRQALSNGVRRADAVRALAPIYSKVIAEFIRSGLPKLRMTPVTSGIFDGDVAQLQEVTVEALQGAFMLLNPDQQEQIMEAPAVELCIFLESEYAGYLRAMRRRPRPTPLFDAAYALVSRAVQQGMRAAAEGSKFSKEKGGAAQLSSLVEVELACLFRSREFVSGGGRGKRNNGNKIDGLSGATEDESAQLAARAEAELGKLIKATTQLTARFNQEFSQLEARFRRNNAQDDAAKQGASAPADKPGAGGGDNKDAREEGDRAATTASVDALIQGFRARAPPRRRPAFQQVAIQSLVGTRSMMMSAKLPAPQEQLRSAEQNRVGSRGTPRSVNDSISSAREMSQKSLASRDVDGGNSLADSTTVSKHDWAFCNERMLHRPDHLYEKIPFVQAAGAS
eukprot:TRINITY_DN16966_c0_g2_i1.p1 TRINITY_DN16966_c0_g2~~TRINITY_DN16966_c0_g2_i1.p1  ORF type:complete len:739 (+),score=170.89 TRINITY_DN16966_c0_g2_i1:73-2289(+)